MRFSDRIGATKESLDLFLDAVPDPLRNSIWNLVIELYSDSDSKRDFCLYLAKNFRKSRVDHVPSRSYEVGVWLESYYFSLPWYQLYNLVEFVVKHHYYIKHHSSGYPIDERRKRSVADSLELRFNQIFVTERSGFRFVGGVLSPIVDKVEIDAVSESIVSLRNSELTGAERHIQAALELFSKRPEPDYRNSIKEAISAVESVAKIFGTKDGDGISLALKILGEKTNLHGALRSAFEKIYGFTSDGDGIRHAMIDDPTVGFDEAKYMIVSCAAFCSYILGKAQSVGLIKKP